MLVTNIERVVVQGYTARVPRCLIQLRDHLFANGGLVSEGIFRLQPDAWVVRLLL
jgi:hypothetical protein